MMSALHPLLLQIGIGGSDLTPAMSQAAYTAAREVIVLCVTLILPALMMMTLTYTISKAFLQSGSLQIDLGSLFKLFFIAIALVVYRELVPLIGETIGGISEIIREPLGGSTAYETLNTLQKNMGLTTAVSTSTTVLNGDVSLTDMLSEAKQQFSTMVDALTNFSVESLLYRLVTQSTVMLVRSIMMYIRMFALGFLFCAGPISIVLSAIPPFGTLWRHWLQNYISIQLWSVTFALLDVLFNAFSDAKTIGTGGLNNVVAGQNNAEYLIACLVFVVMYFMVPTLTSWVIGSSAVQGFVGAVAGAATGAAAGAITGGGALASPMPHGGGVADVAGRMLQRVTGGGSSSSGGSSAGGGDEAVAPPPVPSMNAPIDNSKRQVSV